MATMRGSIAIAMALLTLGGLPSAAASGVTIEELLRILDVHVWRIRVPTDPAFVWDIQVLKKVL